MDWRCDGFFLPGVLNFSRSNETKRMASGAAAAVTSI
jgi:hypothetical protein